MLPYLHNVRTDTIISLAVLYSESEWLLKPSWVSPETHPPREPFLWLAAQKKKYHLLSRNQLEQSLAPFLMAVSASFRERRLK